VKTANETNSPPVPAFPGVSVYEGDARGAGLRIGIVCARFNSELTGALTRGCVRELERLGVAPDRIALAWVPGAYEVPYVIDRWARGRKFDALIGLGCVIQGETPHAGLINAEVARALAEIARLRDVPVIDTVVSANTPEQAAARCTDLPTGRGAYAAQAAVEMARLRRAIEDRSP
jgi:6,7-dimethyl-8-ribityllumazine synthase